MGSEMCIRDRHHALSVTVSRCITVAVDGLVYYRVTSRFECYRESLYYCRCGWTGLICLTARLLKRAQQIATLIKKNFWSSFVFLSFVLFIHLFNYL